MSGLDLATAIRDKALTCRILVVSTFAWSGYLRRMLDAGVAGYAMKAVPVAELDEVLRTVRDDG